MAEILALDQNGQRLMPLVSGARSSDAARAIIKKRKAQDLFPLAKAPEEAFGGLLLYFSCFEECHAIVQELSSQEASFWHAILHRQEPDPGNASYWFRRVGAHSVFPQLNKAARGILARYPDSGFRPTQEWDPFAFVDFCERVRRNPGSSAERAAAEIQRTEWQLLFDCCARSQA